LSGRVIRQAPPVNSLILVEVLAANLWQAEKVLPLSDRLITAIPARKTEKSLGLE